MYYYKPLEAVNLLVNTHHSFKFKERDRGMSPDALFKDETLMKDDMCEIVLNDNYVTLDKDFLYFSRWELIEGLENEVWVEIIANNVLLGCVGKITDFVSKDCFSVVIRLEDECIIYKTDINSIKVILDEK